MRSSIMFCVAVLVASFAVAQTPEEEASSYYQNEEWGNAAAAYRRIVEMKPDDVRSWFRLGLSLHRAGQYDDALAAYENLLALDGARAFHPTVRFRGAESLALRGDTAGALEWLERAVELGFAPASALEQSEALAAVRADDRFAGIVDQARRNTTPCEYKEAYRQFDFWIGEWDVFDPSGQRVGSNTIEKTVNGCVLLENWMSTSGGVGKSFNFYDAADGQWHQLWIDGTGSVLRLSGKLRDGLLHYQGESPTPDGGVRKERLRFFDLGDGRVRQLWEQSTDGGETWLTVFDGEYRRQRPR